MINIPQVGVFCSEIATTLHQPPLLHAGGLAQQVMGRDVLHQLFQELLPPPLHVGGHAQYQLRRQAMFHQPVQDFPPPPVQDGFFPQQMRGCDVLHKLVSELQPPQLQQQGRSLINPEANSPVEIKDSS